MKLFKIAVPVFLVFSLFFCSSAYSQTTGLPRAKIQKERVACVPYEVLSFMHQQYGELTSTLQATRRQWLIYRSYCSSAQALMQLIKDDTEVSIKQKEKLAEKVTELKQRLIVLALNMKLTTKIREVLKQVYNEEMIKYGQYITDLPAKL